MKLNELEAEVHANAVAHGWWDQEPSVGEIIALCHSELSEALEEYRAGRPMLYYPCNAGGPCVDDWDGVDCASRTYDPEHPDAPCSALSDKPGGIAVELADCILRILDWFGKEGLDAEELIQHSGTYMDCWGDLPVHTCTGGTGERVAELHMYLALAYRLWLDGAGVDAVALRMALCVSRVCDWAEENGVDMGKVLAAKHAYNKGRSYRHGGKRL